MRQEDKESLSSCLNNIAYKSIVYMAKSDSGNAQVKVVIRC